jgi:ElaB/YqjD/DUF883 family membrane-anchored ribosome-binding protein
MERNTDDMFGGTGETGSPTGSSSSFAASESGMAGSTAPPGGLEVVQDKFGKVRDKARDLQSTLADRLDAGADKLRQRTQPAPLDGGPSAVAVAADDRMANVQDSVARGMNKSADWLRNGDLKADIEKQVRENPGRTLLIALGIGYLLGKAVRKDR